MSLNRITVQGRLCAAPELRQTQNGKAVANFTLAKVVNVFVLICEP